MKPTPKNSSLRLPLPTTTAVNLFQQYAPKILITGLIVGGVVLGPKLFKSWRRNVFAKKNIGNPDVQAAVIIRKSFTKLEFPGVLSWVFSDLHLWTNESELFKIARKVTSLKEVSRAYKILFDTNLLDDLKTGFSSAEFKKFFEIIQGKEGNPNVMKLIPVGDKVYSAMKSPLTIYEAKYDKGKNKWVRTNNLWKKVNYNDEIGNVYRIIKFSEKSRFYIVDGGFFKTGYGLVWDNTIKNTID